MSENKREAGMSSVMFFSPHASDLFPTPVPLPPAPYPLAVPEPEHEIISHHIMVGLLSLSANTALAPLERVHLLMQNQNEMIKSGCLSTPYKGIKDCFLRTVKQEGFFSLWRGNSLNIFKAFTSQALAVAIMKNSWHNEAHNKNDEYGYLKYEAAVLSATLLEYPLDYARTCLATDVTAARRTLFSLDSARKNLIQEIRTRQFSGVLDVYSKTLKKDGIVGLYRGYYLSVIGVMAWDFIRDKVEHQGVAKGELTWLHNVLIPAAMLYNLPAALYPMTSSVSRRMMMNSGEASVIKYKNPVHAVREIVKHEGFCSLYKGVTAGMTLCFARIGVGAALIEWVPYLVDQFRR